MNLTGAGETSCTSCPLVPFLCRPPTLSQAAPAFSLADLQRHLPARGDLPGPLHSGLDRTGSGAEGKARARCELLPEGFLLSRQPGMCRGAPGEVSGLVQTPAGAWLRSSALSPVYCSGAMTLLGPFLVSLRPRGAGAAAAAAGGMQTLPPGKGAWLAAFTALELIVSRCGRRALSLRETINPFPASALPLEAQNRLVCWGLGADAYRNNGLGSRGEETRPIPREKCMSAAGFY